MEMVDRSEARLYTKIRIYHIGEERVYGTAHQMVGIRLFCRALL